MTFKISDMFMGKCVFLEVEDIILTVKEIKESVKNDDKKKKDHQSREQVANKPPISDITLKITVNE